MKESIAPEELLFRHRNLQQKVLEGFLAGKGKFEKFENEYLEKLKNEINAAYEEFHETSSKQYAIQQRMVESRIMNEL